MRERPRIGVSACLLGENVRFDGGHCHSDFVDALKASSELVPVCPEIELGLGAPRPSLRLLRRKDNSLSLVSPATERDLTFDMQRLARRRVAELGPLDGFVVKKGSPSCGLERVRVYGETVTRDGRGLFTAILMSERPLLPVEDDGRLHDDVLRERFVLRVGVHHRLRTLFASNWRLSELIEFHASMKLELLAASPKAYRDLGRLVAHGKRIDREELSARYFRELMTALANVPTRGRHVNVLQHIAGYFADEDRPEIHQLIADYAAGREARASALVLLRHHAKKYPYLVAQRYLRRSV